MDIHEIVKKLIGNIEPVGETRSDNASFENLETMIKLTDALLLDLHWVSKEKDRYEDSVRKAGMRARKFLDGLDEEYCE
jgi:hypothetical protein